MAFTRKLRREPLTSDQIESIRARLASGERLMHIATDIDLPAAFLRQSIGAHPNLRRGRSRRKPLTLTSDQLKSIRTRLDNGERLTPICREMNIPFAQLRAAIGHHAAIIRGRSPELLYELLADLLLTDQLPLYIARKHGVTRQRVSQIMDCLVDAGFPLARGHGDRSTLRTDQPINIKMEILRRKAEFRSGEIPTTEETDLFNQELSAFTRRVQIKLHRISGEI